MKLSQLQKDEQNEQFLLREKELLIGAIDAYKRKAAPEHLTIEATQRLVNVLVTLGELRRAFDLAVLELGYHKANEIEDIIEAVERDNRERCSCEDDIVHQKNGKNITIPRFFKWKRLRSPIRMNMWINIYRCAKCGFLQGVSSLPETRHVEDARRLGEKKRDIEVFDV